MSICDLAPFFCTSRVLYPQSCAELSICDVSFDFLFSCAEFLLRKKMRAHYAVWECHCPWSRRVETGHGARPAEELIADDNGQAFVWVVGASLKVKAKTSGRLDVYTQQKQRSDCWNNAQKSTLSTINNVVTSVVIMTGRNSLCANISARLRNQGDRLISSFVCLSAGGILKIATCFRKKTNLDHVRMKCSYIPASSKDTPPWRQTTMAGSKCCVSWCVAGSSSSNHILCCVAFWASKFGIVTKVREGEVKKRLILDAKATAASKCVRVILSRLLGSA